MESQNIEWLLIKFLNCKYTSKIQIQIWDQLIDALSSSDKTFDFKMTTTMMLSFYIKDILETITKIFKEPEKMLEDEETYELVIQLDQKILELINRLSSKLHENREDAVLACEGVKKPIN